MAIGERTLIEVIYFQQHSLGGAIITQSIKWLPVGHFAINRKIYWIFPW